MMINENTSKFDRDLSSFSNCAKDIIEEVDVQEEEKRALKEKEASEKAAMEKNETTLLNNNESRKRKEVDGKERLHYYILGQMNSYIFFLDFLHLRAHKVLNHHN